ncbi:MAG: hypothetical protein DRO40_12820 [Thermoprotei archaeon]|nr:hypothetical protein [Candidatus Culexmicrobium cathedralense]RLG79470.1 MAG: hypothetical protein DRO40_12820 [Thermoprotei archaeon]
MKLNKLILITFFIWIVVASLIILIPMYMQINKPIIIIFTSSPPTYDIEKNTTTPTWSEEISIKLPFTMPRNWIGNSNIKVNYEYFVEIETEEWRTTIINYTLILNGKPIRSIREDFEGTYFKIAGSLPKTIIKPELLKDENQLTINVKILQKGLLKSESSFKLQIRNPQIRIEALDSDGDGIYDIFDSAPKINNIFIATILSVIGLPISIRAEKIYKEK